MFRYNSWYIPFIVALHPEGVDRNPCLGLLRSLSLNVALHPEGVDRNSTIIPVK